jgi:wyosine [tRNA(Phe)-imidazoG37] synthetase (radical SAM superfamily)
MKYVYGPVPSRRLGQSLGIDTIPLKTCNWNCVYCQLGRSKPLTNERKDYIPLSEIISEVKRAISTHSSEEIDWITFVGSGEPTLHAGIGWLIKEVKKLTDIPVAVITNGSLLFLQSVRKALHSADAVLPSFDAGTPELYRKINRPHPEITFERFLDGLIAFRCGYKGQLWVEVMLVQDLNDTEEALNDIAKGLEQIQPDEVHINMPVRPPAEVWVKPTNEEGIMRATAILGKIAQVIHPQEGKFDLSGSENIIEAIIGIVTRHPMSEEQLYRALESLPTDQKDQIINSLKASNQAQIIERFGKQFWCASPSVFPDTGKLNKPSVHKQHKE